MAPKKKVDTPTKILLGRPKGTLKMGLVGLPNVGKSSTFNLLCKQSIPAENFPFCTIDPHEARMSVPDERFEWLVDLFKPKSEVAASLSIFDIAGLVSGASQGEGLGNAFLSHIQAVDGIFHVVRAFDDDEIIHTEGDVNPIRDLGIIATELRLKDEERAQKKCEELEKLCNRNQDKTKKAELEIANTILQHLKSGAWINNTRVWTQKEVDFINETQFLTAKPIVYLVNMSSNDFTRQKNKWLPKIHEWVQSNIPGPIVPFSAAFEAKFLEEGPAANETARSQISKIIKTGYESLNLIHYFTCGADEVKCWTIREGTKAPQAAGIIHTDMENGFICADVTKYADLKELKSESACKAAGKVATKGKDYVVTDGDILFFKFNPSGGGKK